MLLVDDELKPLRRYFGLILDECINLLASAIGGCVIDEDDVIILIILHEDAAHVLEMAILVDIVVAGYYNAEG